MPTLSAGQAKSRSRANDFIGISTISTDYTKLSVALPAEPKHCGVEQISRSRCAEIDHIVGACSLWMLVCIWSEGIYIYIYLYRIHIHIYIYTDTHIIYIHTYTLSLPFSVSLCLLLPLRCYFCCPHGVSQFPSRWSPRSETRRLLGDATPKKFLSIAETQQDALIEQQTPLLTLNPKP